MNAGRKWLPQTQPPARTQRPLAVAQPKSVAPAQLKSATPNAPAVYRPQPTPKVLQAKKAAAQSRTHAPAVYRPKPKEIVQPKAEGVPLEVEKLVQKRIGVYDRVKDY